MATNSDNSRRCHKSYPSSPWKQKMITQSWWHSNTHSCKFALPSNDLYTLQYETVYHSPYALTVWYVIGCVDQWSHGIRMWTGSATSKKESCQTEGWTWLPAHAPCRELPVNWQWSGGSIPSAAIKEEKIIVATTKTNSQSTTWVGIKLRHKLNLTSCILI